MANAMLRSAVLHKLTVIGEAASKISPELKARYPHIEWGDITGFRNYVIHAYFSVDWEIVWNAAIAEVPILQQQIERIIKEEFGG